MKFEQSYTVVNYN